MVVGVLITAVDATIVVLALPEIQRSLHIGLASVIWVIIGYLLVITLLSTQVGRLGDMFGRVRMYEAGFVIFVVGSLACALAWNELSLIGFRVVQGVGGAFIAANSGAVIADTFPKEQRGRAYGFNAVGFNTGAVLGVVLGGIIVTYVSWRWIFWINVPIGVAAVAVASRVLSERGERDRAFAGSARSTPRCCSSPAMSWAESLDRSRAGSPTVGVPCCLRPPASRSRCWRCSPTRSCSCTPRSGLSWSPTWSELSVPVASSRRTMRLS